MDEHRNPFIESLSFLVLAWKAVCYKAAAMEQRLVDGQEVHNLKAPRPGKQNQIRSVNHI